MDRKNSRFILTFEWHSLLRDLCRNFWLIILAGVITSMGIYISERSIYTPLYTSQATMVVRAKTGTSGTYTNLSVSADMANIFTTVFKDSSMKKKAAENLGMDSFPGTVYAAAGEGINLMSLAVTADDPELAYNLLSSILEVYPNISEAVFSDAVIDILIAPQMPTAPSNTISGANRGLITVCMMGVMTMMIVGLSLLRDTVKHEKSFEASIDQKLLSTITHEKPHLSLKEYLMRKKRALLIDDAFATLKFTEDYRKTAARLEHMHKHHDCRTFAVTSVAENEGKSTAAANIALVLASRGFRVMLLDMDFRKPSVHKIFDCTADVEIEFSDVLSRKIPFREYRYLRYRKNDLFLAMNTKPCSGTAGWLGAGFVRKFINSLRNNVDFVIVDTPPAASSADAASVISVCDRTLLVVRTDTVATADINDTIMSIENIGGNLAGCILNDVYKPFTLFGQMGADEHGGYNYHYRPGSHYSRYGNRLSQYMFVPEDEESMEQNETDRSDS